MTVTSAWVRAIGLFAVAAVVGVAPTAAGQAPTHITGDQVSVQEAGGALGSRVQVATRGTELVWVAYAVPALHADGGMCCHHHDAGGSDLCGVCRLTGHSALAQTASTERTIELVADPEITVLARFEKGEVTRIRTLSPDCRIDADEQHLVWLEGVTPAASLAWLSAVVETSSETAAEGILEGAVGAVAQHSGNEAWLRLRRWSEPGSRGSLREQAVFWMGAARRPEAWPHLAGMLRDEPDPKLRERAVFAAYLSQAPQSIDALVRVAHDDTNRRIRGSALMWLAQLAGERAAAAITTSVDDPDVEIRKSAVFALSQLPADRGVPLLIRVATTHAHPDVRRQAIFWLGQSGDERALALIEDLLANG